MRIRVNGPPVRVSMPPPPPFERRNMAPFANGPHLSKEETRPGPLTWGGRGTCFVGQLELPRLFQQTLF